MAARHRPPKNQWVGRLVGWSFTVFFSWVVGVVVVVVVVVVAVAAVAVAVVVAAAAGVTIVPLFK